MVDLSCDAVASEGEKEGVEGIEIPFTKDENDDDDDDASSFPHSLRFLSSKLHSSCVPSLQKHLY